VSGTTFKKLRKEHFFEAGDLEQGGFFRDSRAGKSQKSRQNKLANQE
jgi:hypothetical protein